MELAAMSGFLLADPCPHKKEGTAKQSNDVENIPQHFIIARVTKHQRRENPPQNNLRKNDNTEDIEQHRPTCPSSLHRLCNPGKTASSALLMHLNRLIQIMR